jgi:four helix bundle protein
MESTEKKKKHITLADLEVYQLARELSKMGWKIYEVLDWPIKKLMGDQFISATDFFGANIAEGYSRYHYLEKIKFFYNARASLAEAREHWLELLKERKKVSEKMYKEYESVAKQAQIKLQNFISAVYRAKHSDE